MSVDEDGDVDGRYDDYEYADDSDEAMNAELSLGELFDQCVVPTLSQTLQMVGPLLGLCLLHRVFTTAAASGEATNSCSVCTFSVNIDVGEL